MFFLNKQKLDINAPCYQPRTFTFNSLFKTDDVSSEKDKNEFINNFEESSVFTNFNDLFVPSGNTDKNKKLSEIEGNFNKIIIVIHIDEISINKIINSNLFNNILKTSKEIRDKSILTSTLNNRLEKYNPFQKERKRECSICLDSIPKEKKLGLLSNIFIYIANCDHIFCVECFKQWKMEVNRKENKELQRACPICLNETLMLIPSDVVISDKEKKLKIMGDNKKKMSLIPCKYLKKGKKVCPFGVNCYYKH